MMPPARPILFSVHASGGELEVRARAVTRGGEDGDPEVVLGRAPLGSRLTILGSADGVWWSEVASLAGAEAIGTHGMAMFLMDADDAKLAGGLVRLRAELVLTPGPPVPRPSERRES